MLKKLSEDEQKLFEKVYKKHFNALGSGEKEKYKKENIIKIERDVPNNCLNVYFGNGEWFRYYVDGTWG